MMSGFGAIAARAQARGELGPDFDVSDLMAAIAGPLFYRRSLGPVLRPTTSQGSSWI
jgi:hypothetical protein